MTSAIDPSKPIEGNPTTASVRDNFAAAKAEIEALQAATTDHEWTAWTPYAAGATTEGTATYSVQAAAYYVIGKLCFFQLRLAWTGHTGTGAFRIKTLPITPSASAHNQQIAIKLVGLATTNPTTYWAAVIPSLDYMTITGLECISGTSTNPNIPAAITSLAISGSYRID